MTIDAKVTFTYTNHRGETRVRTVVPIDITLANTSYHPETQWLLNAYDCDKLAERTFAMKDIKDWKPA